MYNRVMSKLLTLSCLALLSSCGETITYYTSPQPPLRYVSDPDLLLLAEVFYEAHPEARRDSVMYWSESVSPWGVKSETLGLCVYSEPPQIILSMEKMDEDFENQVKAVLWHELGHCALGLKHTDKSAPVNLMLPSLHPDLVASPEFYMLQL